MLANQLARLNTVVRPAGHIFFGWYIVAAAGGIQMLSGMLWMQSYGAYMVLLQEEFGWSAALIAGAFALTRIESGILGPLQGWLVDKYGPRPVLTAGILLFGTGFILFSFVHSILTFYLAFVLIAVGASIGGFATLMVSLVNWFSVHRAKAISLSQVGYSVGGLCVPLVVLCLEAFGWRTTAVISGITVFLVGLPLVHLVKHRPAEMGETVDGLKHIPKAAPIAHDLAAWDGFSKDFTAKEAMKTRSFWLISFGHAAALLMVSSVMVHLVPHLTRGTEFSLSEAAFAIALLTGFQLAGQLVGGYLGDRFNKRLICFSCMCAHALGLVLVAYADSFMDVFAFAALHGLAWGIRGPLMVALRADYFGPTYFGTIMGFSSLIVMLGMSGGPIFAGYMADVYGDYERGFSYLAAAVFLGSFCFVFATPPGAAKRCTDKRSAGVQG